MLVLFQLTEDCFQWSEVVTRDGPYYGVVYEVRDENNNYETYTHFVPKDRVLDTIED